MRIIHTSDWHLGRSLCGASLLPSQAVFLDWLVALATAEQVDAVLVSGDIYDRALPSPETVALLSESLSRLVQTGAKVIVISGNHDSAVRLGFGAPLLAMAGLHVVTDLRALGQSIAVGDGHVYPLPYLEPALVADAVEAPARTHAAVVTAAMARVHASASSLGGPTVVMAHAFVMGGVASDTERDISVGGVQVVPASVFDGVSYAALGHLHRAQTVAGRIRYSGAPLTMSFADLGHTPSVSLVEVGADHLRVDAVPTPVVRRLVRLEGELEGLLADPRHTDAESAWCHVTLTDPARPQGAIDRLRRRFPDVLKLEFAPSGVVVPTGRYAARARPGHSELDVCVDFLGHVRGGRGPSPGELTLLRQAIDETRIGAAAEAEERGLDSGAA